MYILGTEVVYFVKPSNEKVTSANKKKKELFHTKFLFPVSTNFILQLPSVGGEGRKEMENFLQVCFTH